MLAVCQAERRYLKQLSPPAPIDTVQAHQTFVCFIEE